MRVNVIKFSLFVVIVSVITAFLTAFTYDQTIGISGGGNPTFENLNVEDDIFVGGTVDGLKIASVPPNVVNLTTGEVNQLSNINNSSIDSTQWEYVGLMNQPVDTSASCTFSNMTVANTTDVRIMTVEEKIVLEPGAVIEGFITPGLPDALTSIANLSTVGNEMIYTTAPNTYATQNISPFSRNLFPGSSTGAWQSNLALVPGSNVQTQSTLLQSMADVGIAANEMFYGISNSQVGTTPLTSQARLLLDDTTAAEQRTTLGLGTVATEDNPAGGLVGLTEAQSLTNKTLLDVSNTVGATHLFVSGGGTVQINGSAAPSPGQGLIAVDSNNATWGSVTQGPGTSTTNNALVRWDGNGGNIIQNSVGVLDDSGNLSGLGQVSCTSLASTIVTASQPNITSVGTLSGLSVSGNIVVTGTVDGVDVSALNTTVGNFPSNLNVLTDSEITQLSNINATTITTDNWINLNLLNQSVNTSASPTFSGVDVNSQKIINLATPTDDTDAATKLYVDQNAQGFAPIDSADYASTANIDGTYAGTPNFTLTENGGPSQLSIDGTVVNNGDRILIKDQTVATTNGVYVVTNNDGVTSWILTRAADFNETSDINNGVFVFVTSGTANNNTGWVVSGLDPGFTLDAPAPTGNINWSQTSGGQTITAGQGLSQNGTDFDVGGTLNRITVNATSIDIANTYVGQASITTLGTISNGVWQGDNIAVANGGTGASNAGTALSNLGGQPLDALLTGLSALTVNTNDLMIYSTGSNTFATTVLTGQARALLDDATAAAQRTTLGLGTIATENAANFVTLTGVETLTNKTLSNGSLIDSGVQFEDDVDATKQMTFELSSISTGTTRTMTVPDSDGTLALLNNVATLNNKTLTNATITDTSNNVVSNALRTSTGVVAVGGSAAPSAGQILIASNATTAAWANIPGSTLARTINVAQSGGDFTSIVDAVNAAVLLNPTVINPVTIEVAPGTYVETNPILVPSHVNINGGNRPGSVLVQGVTNTLAVFTLSEDCSMSNLTAIGSTGFGGVGFRYDGDALSPNSFCTLIRCNALNCETGFLVTSPVNSTNFSILNLQDCTAFIDTFGAMTNGFIAQTGATIGAFNCRASGFAAGLILNAGFLANGENSFISMQACSAIVCTAGFVSQNGGSGTVSRIRAISCISNQNITGVFIGANAEADLVATEIINTLGLFDLNVSTATSTILGSGNELREDKVNIAPGSSNTLAFISLTPNQPSFIVESAFQVGSINESKQSSLGGGGAHTFGQYVRTTSDDIVFNNFDTVAADTVNSFPPWPGTGVNNILYIGGDRKVYPGVRIDVNIAPILGTGAFAPEYWNGGAWTTLPFMITEANAPYLPRLMYNDSTAYNVRFGLRPGWVQNTVDGQQAFWIRFRIVSPITSVGLVLQVELQTDHTQVDEDGFVEYFGKAMTRKLLPDFAGRLEAATLTPGNQDLYVSDTLYAGFVENAFSGTAIEQAGLFYQMPADTFTGAPLRFSWKWSASTNGGRCSWTVFWGFTTSVEDNATASSDLFEDTATAPGTGPNEQSTTILWPPAPTTITDDRVYTTTVDLDISGMICARDTGSQTGDTLWISLRRNGNSGADNNNGDANVFAIGGSYVSWCNGQYDVNL